MLPPCLPCLRASVPALPPNLPCLPARTASLPWPAVHCCGHSGAGKFWQGQALPQHRGRHALRGQSGQYSPGGCWRWRWCWRWCWCCSCGVQARMHACVYAGLSSLAAGLPAGCCHSRARAEPAVNCLHVMLLYLALCAASGSRQEHPHTGAVQGSKAWRQVGRCRPASFLLIRSRRCRCRRSRRSSSLPAGHQRCRDCCRGGQQPHL